MLAMYENMPLPLYLITTIGSALLLTIYFYKKRREFPHVLLVGIYLIAVSSLLAGMSRIMLVFEIVKDDEIKYYLTLYPFIILVGLLLLGIGAYIKLKDNPEKRKIVLLTNISIYFMLLVLFIIIITVKSSN